MLCCSLIVLSLSISVAHLIRFVMIQSKLFIHEAEFDKYDEDVESE